MINMLSDIDILKEKLDKLIQKEAPYTDIYHLSCEIDELLVDYYKRQDYIKELILRK